MNFTNKMVSMSIHYRHIYNDKQLDDIGHEGDDHEYRILNHFFNQTMDAGDEDGGGYWTDDGCR